MNGGRPQEHGEVTRHTDGVGQTPAMQGAPKDGDIAEFGIGENRRNRQLAGARPSNQV